MRTDFQILTELANAFQPIRRKYPVVVAYAKHLQKISDDESAVEKEIDHFRAWLTKNPRLAERLIDDPFYVSSKHSIVVSFQNVVDVAAPDVSATVWESIGRLDSYFFPFGHPSTETRMETDDEATPTTGASAALAILEDDPLFSEVVKSVKSVAETLDPNDIGSMIESEEFNGWMNKIGSGLRNGTYKPKDLTKTLRSVLGTIPVEDLGPDMKDLFDTASTVINSAENGKQPDITRLMTLINKAVTK